MDTLFRLFSSSSSTLQSDHLHLDHHHHHHQSNNSSRTSSSSRSELQSDHHYLQQDHHHQNEESLNHFNDFMEEEDFSSSNSTHYNYPYSSTTAATTITTATTTTTPTQADQYFSYSPSHHDLINFEFSGKWSHNMLLQAAQAITEKNSTRVQQLLWALNELSSPYGDIDQKLTAYFLKGLFTRVTDSGERSYRTLTAASEKSSSFESTRKTVLKFQEVSPWTTFGHVSANGAIMEVFENESKLHIIDFSNTFCTQWPTLLEAIATRTDETPHLKLTTVIATRHSGGEWGESLAAAQKVMKEIGARMEKFARLMGVPFKLNAIYHSGDLSDLNLAELDIKEDEALAINCIGALHSVAPISNRRDYLISLFRSLRPRVITVVEEEADLDVGIDGIDFAKGFQECLSWFRIYFETLEESFPRVSNERLMLERAAGRAIVDLVACPASESVERRESAKRWIGRLTGTGFTTAAFSDEICDDVRALLRRYKEGWSMVRGSDGVGIFLAWKDQPVVWASAWRP